MSAVSLLGPVPGVTPEREVGRGATGGSVAHFASVLSDQDLRLCESHFRLRDEDASRTPSDSDSEGSTPIGADTTGALLLQLSVQKGSSVDAVTTPPVGASTPGGEAMTEPESFEAGGGDRPGATVSVGPLSPTDLTKTERAPTELAMTGAAGTDAQTGAPTMIGAPATTGAPTTTGAGDVETARAAAGSATAVRPAESRRADETAVTPAGSSRVSAEAPMPSAAPSAVAPSVSVTAPDTFPSVAQTSTSAAVDATLDAAAPSGGAASPGASGASDDAPVAVERAQPPVSAVPTAVPAPAPAPVTPTAPLAASEASAAITRAVASQVSPVVVSIAQHPAGTHHLTLTVNPDSLGPVTLRAHIGASGDVQVELSGATEIGREALRTMLVDLRRDLAGVMPHATLSVGVGTGAEPPADRGGQPGAGGAAGDPSANERDGRPRQHPESEPGRTAPGVIPTTTIATGAGLDIFA